MPLQQMNLRQLNTQATRVRIFLVQEPPSPAPVGQHEAHEEHKRPEGRTGRDASLELAIRLGLVDDPGQGRDIPVKTFRVLGFDPKHLWCESTKLVALNTQLYRVLPYDAPTNCGGPNEVSYVDWDRNEPLPFLSLDYFESLLSYAESDGGDLTVYDSPSLDARIEEIWWDGTRFHARVWIKGSYKGKSKTTTVEFIYDPIQETICAEFENVKNDYIRVEDIEVCWYLLRNVICARATVIWRPAPQIRAHLEACMALPAFTGPGKPGDSAVIARVSCSNARDWVKEHYEDYEWGDCDYPDPASAEAFAAGLIAKLVARHGSQGNFTSGHRTINHGSPAPNTFMPYAGWNP